MNQVPSKVQQALPAIMGFIGVFLSILGAGADDLFSKNPEIAAQISWPVGLSGLLITAGAFFTSHSNLTKAIGAPPPGPMSSVAVAAALENNDPDLAQRLLKAYHPDGTVPTLKRPSELPKGGAQ